MPVLPVQLQLVLLLIVLTAAVYDLRSRRIPNWLVLAGIVLGFGCNFALDGAAGLKRAGIGFLVGFGVYFVLHLIRAMGAGDVKLMGAVGAIAGMACWWPIFVYTAILGGVIALILMFSKGRARQTLWNVSYILNEFSHMRSPHTSRADLDVKNPTALRLPHAVTIALGTLCYLIVGWVRSV